MKTGNNNNFFFRMTLLLFALPAATSSTMAQSILFDHLRTSDGISEYSVNAIHQDELQRIWIATRDGLNLYDGGGKIEVFRPAPNDTTAIGHNIYNVTGDGKGTIFIHSESGLHSYDMRRHTFEMLVGPNVERIAAGREHLWFSIRNELRQWNRQTKTAETYYQFDNSINITCIYEADDNMIYVGTRDDGLMLLDKKRNVTNLIPDINTICIFEDSQKSIWVGALKQGLFHIDHGNVTNYRHAPQDPNSLSNDFVRCINQDHAGNYWIGTFDGLNCFDRQHNRFTRYYHSDQQPFSIGSNSIWSITRDAQGTMWIGSFYGCVDRFNPEYLFSHYYMPSSDDSGLCGGVIGSIAEDASGNLWICSENSGLNFFDRKQNRFQWYMYQKDDRAAALRGALKDILYDKEMNSIWIGSHIDGLNRMNLTDKSITRVNFASEHAGNDYVRRILPYGGKLILGTHNSVYVFDKRSGKARMLVDPEKYHLTYRQIWDMMIDSKQRLWFSTSSAIYRYRFDRDELTIFEHRPDDPTSLQGGNLYVFTEDRQGRLWVGSAGGGISVINDNAQTFRRYDTTNSQLIDDYVIDLLETPMGYILAATNKGISRFDYRNDIFHNYHSDIYPLSMLSERALGKTREGELVVGSINGMLIIREEELNIKPKDYSVWFSQLSVNNTVVRPGDKSGVLQQAIEYTDTIELYPRHTTFRIDFTTSNHIGVIHPVIQYMLEGFDEEWVTVSTQDNITYTNLSPGKYRLVIRTFPDPAAPDFAQKKLTIVIHPPFYRTATAYLLYTLLTCVLIYLFSRYYTNHIKLRSSLEFAEREKARIKELNAMKLQFFTNISHELRTPLTLIIAQLESISRTGNITSSVSRKILNALSNTDKMNRLIGEILDFNKQESGFLHLTVEQADLSAFVTEVCAPFREYAITQGISMSVRSISDQPIPMWFDKTQLEKVIYNLLSNAFRATKPSGRIDVTVSLDDSGTACISVADTGCGISPDQAGMIFERFYQASDQSNQAGSGIGLALSKGIINAHKGTLTVESKLNEGSVFTITLQPGDAHFDPDTPRITTRQNETYLLPQDTSDPDEDSAEENIRQPTLDVEMQPQDRENLRTILIVEDNVEILQTLNEIFSPYYNVLTAVNGAEGFAKTETSNPDLVLADVVMPVMDGIEMCKKIKSNFNTCHIPVVLLTARVAVEHIIFGFQQAADDYIIKPFNTKLLLARCNNIISNRLMLQSHYQHSQNNDVKLIATNSYDQELIDKATRLVEINMQNCDFGIDQFAREMYLGRTNLFRKIKGITGQTPNEFIINIRLKKSLALLRENPHMPIYQIAMMVGFNEDTYFMRCFKKTFGKTPSQYREEFLGL